MSSQSVALNTTNALTVNSDLSKIFIGDNRYENDSYINNSSYNPITLLAGTVLGRISSSGIMVPCNASATNGSQYPVGILAEDIMVPAGTTRKVALCIGGDVAEEKVIFFEGNTLETVVDNRRYRDRIKGDTLGINLVPGTEMTAYDNQ